MNIHYGNKKISLELHSFIDQSVQHVKVFLCFMLSKKIMQVPLFVLYEEVIVDVRYSVLGLKVVSGSLIHFTPLISLFTP